MSGFEELLQQEQSVSVQSKVDIPPKPRAEAEIIDQWQGDIEHPLVSIICITYNHAKYIEDAINSFLMQETCFSFEIWIYDDASTDGASDKIKAYQSKYPKIIKTIIQTENQYSKGRKGMSFLHGKLKGKYVAVCEGDDYWTDPKKLQLQVDFLEHNPDYVISGHDAFVIDENGRKIKNSKLPDSHKRDFSQDELIDARAWVLTMSWVYRNVLKEFAPERNMVKNGDNFLVSILGSYGKSHYHFDIKPAAYRVHSGGVWSSANNDAKLDDVINTWFWMYRYYKRIGNEDAAKIYNSHFQKSVLMRVKLSALFREIIIKVFFLRNAKAVIRSFFSSWR